MLKQNGPLSIKQAEQFWNQLDNAGTVVLRSRAPFHTFKKIPHIQKASTHSTHSKSFHTFKKLSQAFI
jgi:hypothetical protein